MTEDIKDLTDEEIIENEDGTIEKYGITFSDVEVMKTYDLAYESFANTIYPLDTQAINNAWYSATYANDIVKDITTPPSVPDIRTLLKMMRNPREHERALTGLSQYLDYTVMQYKRSIKHFASLFTFNYNLIPVNMPKEKSKMPAFLRNEEIVLEWLRKFRIKEQLRNVMEGVMLEDAKFLYLRDRGNYIDLQEMPSEYSYITGDSSIGYTYAFNMLYFAQYGFTEKGYPRDSFAPEFEDWYNDFLEVWRTNKYNLSYYYQPMRRDKSVVFKMDENRAAVVPPLSGVFKDALDIQEYKDLMKTKTKLDTWKIIFQQIPVNKDTGKPSIDAKTVGKFVSTTQARMPQGTKTMASPMTPTPISFDSAQTKDNIIGLGNDLYWDNVGVAQAINGGGDVNSAGALKYSVIADYGFISNMLHQFERFVNYQLRMETGNHNFEIKFVENDTIFSNGENQDRALKLAQFGVAGAKSQAVALQGIEPHQAKDLARYEEYLGYNDWVPLNSSHVAQGNDEGGREKKDVADLSESGEVTQNHDSNANKV